MKKLVMVILVIIMMSMFLSVGCNGARVSELEKQVADLQGQLNTKTQELIVAQGQVTDLQGQVADLQGQLNTKTQELADTQGQVTDLQGQVADLQEQFNTKTQELADARGQVTDLQVQGASLQKQFDDLLATQLKNPTYAQAVAFITTDNTTEPDHCLGAIRIIRNAANQRWKCYWVVVTVKGVVGYGLNFVGFETPDKGWVYFVAGNIYVDREVILIVGQELMKLNPFFGSVSYDDTITEILPDEL